MEEKHKFDLVQRTTNFSKNIIILAKTIPKNCITLPLLSQFIRSGTSIGANYCEADCAESKRDFEHKIAICRKEAHETTYWLDLLLDIVPLELREKVQTLKIESDELRRIFVATDKTSRKNT